MENDIANSAHFWFLKTHLEPPVKPFENKTFFMYQPDDKTAAYIRLIVAGGGRIVSEIKDASIIIRSNKANAAISIPAGITVECAYILSQWIIVPIQERL